MDKYRFKYAVMSGYLHHELDKLVGTEKAQSMMDEAMKRAVKFIDDSDDFDEAIVKVEGELLTGGER